MAEGPPAARPATAASSYLGPKLRTHEKKIKSTHYNQLFFTTYAPSKFEAMHPQASLEQCSANGAPRNYGLGPFILLNAIKKFKAHY